MTPYACVWLLRDPRAHLDDAVSQAIVAGLNIQMQEKQWNIQTLQVREDYVYLLADVPGEDPAYKIVRDLKRRSAEIAHAQNPAYLRRRFVGGQLSGGHAGARTRPRGNSAVHQLRPHGIAPSKAM